MPRKYTKKSGLSAATKAEVKRSLLGKRTLPHIAELLEQFLDEHGGVRMFARTLNRFLEGDKPILQAKALDIVSHLFKGVSATNGRLEDLGVLSDEDLLREAQGIGILGADDGEEETQTEGAATRRLAGNVAGPLPEPGSTGRPALPRPPAAAGTDAGGPATPGGAPAGV